VELIEAIILALPTEDILFAATVSTQWQQIVENSPQIYQRFDMPWYVWTQSERANSLMEPPRNISYRLDEGYFACEVLSNSLCPYVTDERFSRRIMWDDSDPHDHIILFFRDFDETKGGSVAVLEQGHKRKLHIMEGKAFHIKIILRGGITFNPTFEYIIKDQVRNVSFSGSLVEPRWRCDSLWAYLKRYHPEVVRKAEEEDRNYLDPPNDDEIYQSDSD
jgi:hypothetical protein